MTTDILEQRLRHAISPMINENTPGMALLIARGGETLFRGACGMADLENRIPVRPEHQFAIASNTKQFTCMAVMMLKEQGLLDYDQPVADFFPDFPDYRFRVTIRQLMNHQGGIPDYTESRDWLSRAKGANADTSEILEFIKTLGDLNFEPGARFSYSNSGYVMLGRIVELLSGVSFGRFLEDRIFAPVGMTHACAPDTAAQRGASLTEGYQLTEDGGYQKQPYDMTLVGYADGNIQATVDDMLAWHRYLYMSQDESLVRRETLKEAFDESHETDMAGLAYGFGLIRSRERGRREIWHSGGTMGFTSRCSRYPDDALSIIMLTNIQGLPKHQLYNRIADQVFALLD